MDVIIEAFNSLGLRLVVVGDGSMLGSLRHMASNSSIEFLGHQDSKAVAQLIAAAKAFVFASREDFGIAPLEAQACGTPVIAYGCGGCDETIIGLPASEATGVFFDKQTPEVLEDAIRFFETCEGEFRPEACRRNAERFGQRRFRQGFRDTLEKLWNRFQQEKGWNRAKEGNVLRLPGNVL
jgi:glycosyltransferase involved in cell wall biosynthesis